MTRALVKNYFRDWRFDRGNGRIEGLEPLDSENLPAEYWCLVSDRRGRLLEVQEYRKAWKAPAIKALSYASDEPGPIFEAHDYNSDGSLRLVHQYYYDDRGRLAERLEFDGQGIPRGRVVSTWSDQDLEVEEAVYDRAGCLKSRHRYAYDDQRQLVEEQVFTGAGRLEGMRRWLYDDRRRVCERQWLNAAGELKTRLVRSYGPDQQVVEHYCVRA